MASKKCPPMERRFNGKCFLNVAGSGSKSEVQLAAKKYRTWGYNVRITSSIRSVAWKESTTGKGRVYTVWRSHDKPKKKVK